MRDFENAKRVFEELQSMVNGLDMIARRAMIENIPNFPSNFYDDYERVKQFFDGASVVDGNPEIENKIGEVLELFDMAELVNDHFLAAAKATHVARPTPAPARAPAPKPTMIGSRATGGLPSASRSPLPPPPPSGSRVDEKPPETSWSDVDVQNAISWLEGTGSDLNRTTAKELKDFYAANGHEAEGDNEKKAAERFKSIIQIASVMSGAESAAGASLRLPEESKRKICAAHSNMAPTLVSRFVDITVAESHERVKRRLRNEAGLEARDKKLPSIICMDGPPGIGKSSIANGLAKGLDTKLYAFDCNAKTGRGPIFGYSKTYASPTHGFYMDAIIKTGRRNPLILLDEVPRLGDEKAKDAMMVITDPGVLTIKDDFLGIEIPKEAVFIATSNDMSRLDPALRDRFVTEELKGYEEADKINIVRNSLLKRELEGNFLDENLGLLDLSMVDDTVDFLVKDYSFTAGVREHVMNIRALDAKLQGLFVTALIEKLKKDGMDPHDSEVKARGIYSKVTQYQLIGEQISTKGTTADLEDKRQKLLEEINTYDIKGILKFDRALITEALGAPKARAEVVKEEIDRDAKEKLEARMAELEKRIAQAKDQGHNTDDLESELKLLRKEMQRGREHGVASPSASHNAPPENHGARRGASRRDEHDGRDEQEGSDVAVDYGFSAPRHLSSSYEHQRRNPVTPAVLSYELSELVCERMNFASNGANDPAIVGMVDTPKNKSLDESWDSISGNTADFLAKANKHELGDGDWVENACEVYDSWQVNARDENKFASVYNKDGAEAAKVDYTKQDGLVKARTSLDGFADPDVADKVIAQMLEVATRVYLETGKNKVKLNGLEDRPDLAVKFMEAAAILAKKDIKLEIEFDSPTVKAVMGNPKSSERVKAIAEIEPNGAEIVKQSVDYDGSEPGRRHRHSGVKH
ncbi:MAG: AAA family ATPase [Francisellaceae bacterium]|nr:AAA family ATPase [Francisellaceae bacterium]